MNKMLWKEKLQEFLEGEVLKYPEDIDETFIWRTTQLTDGNDIYIEEFIINKNLDIDQDYQSFNKYIKESDNKYATVFKNISGDTTLIIPMPRKGKNFSNLKNFIDEASKIQQKKFWKCVAETILDEMEIHDKLFVSTHGLGVPYLHVRICNRPKYYGNSKLI